LRFVAFDIGFAEGQVFDVDVLGVIKRVAVERADLVLVFARGVLPDQIG